MKHTTEKSRQRDKGDTLQAGGGNKNDPTTLKIRLFGTFQVTLREQPISRFRSANNQGLLVYLALQSSKPISRESLITLFWPDVSIKNGRNNLRQSLYQLRKLLTDGDKHTQPFLRVTRQTVQFNPDSSFSLDVQQFLEAIDSNDLETAVSLYSGELLPGFTCDSLEFEDWLRQEREQLHNLALEAMSEWTRDCLENGRFAQAQTTAQNQLRLEPWREQAHRQLMQAYALSGERSKALQQFERCQAMLEDELGLDPTAPTLKLREDIKAGRLAPVISVEHRLAPKTTKHNLPLETTPLIGREVEIAQIKRRIIEKKQKLVTIIGPGGMGKTRLGLAVGRELLESFQNGVYFVDLTPLANAEAIPQAIATALDYQPPDNSLKLFPQLLKTLRNQNLLLILDNFEHLLSGTIFINEIMQTCSEISLLTTSRQRLKLASEHRFELGGLQAPEKLTPEDAMAHTAVQLFVDHGRRVKPAFALTGENLKGIVRICQLVQGMPLGLLLAASWLEMLSPAEIAVEVKKGIDFLEADLADLPMRQRSMQAVFEYSWQQMQPAEKAVLAKLTVFRGGFTREAAEKVAEANLRILLSLVNKSLLWRDEESGRFTIHELLRQYGEAKLEKLEEKTAVQEKHCAYFCNTLLEWKKELNSPRLMATIPIIEVDYQNILVAWRLGLKKHKLDYLLIATDGLSEYFDANGRWIEGIQLYRATVQQLRDERIESSQALRLIFSLSSWLVHFHFNSLGMGIDHKKVYEAFLAPLSPLLEHPNLTNSDWQQEEAFYCLQLGRILKYLDGKLLEGELALQRSQQLYEALGLKLGLADAIFESSFYAVWEGMIEKANELLNHCLILLKELNDPRRLLNPIIGLARNQQDISKAETLLEQAYTTAQSNGLIIGMADVKRVLAVQYWTAGYFEKMRIATEETIHLGRLANSSVREGIGMTLLAINQVYQGQFKIALERIEQIKQLQQEKGLPPHLGWFDDAQSMIFLHTRQYDKVRDLASQRLNRRTLNGLIWSHLISSDYEKALSLGQEHKEELYSDKSFLIHVNAPMSLAYINLGQTEKAYPLLVEALEISVKRRIVDNLLNIIPIVARLLIANEDIRLKERGVELWAMAHEIPYIKNSQLFTDLIGQAMNNAIANIPVERVNAAQSRGRTLEILSTSESLQHELRALLS